MLLVFLGFLLLAVPYTTPLVTHLGDALPFAAVPPEGRETPGWVQGDYLQFYYYLWLVRDRVLAGASFLRDPYQFAIDGPRWNLPNTFLPFALFYVPLSVAGPRLAYNLLVLLSFPFAGLSATLLAHRYGIGRWPSIVAGAVFACAPYRVGALLGGHPSGLAFFLAPLALWGLEGALAGSAAGGAWCGIALASAAIVEPHFFYFAALGLPLYLLARVGLAGWSRDALRVGPLAWSGALAVAAAPAWGALAAFRRQGWQPAPGVRLTLALAIVLGMLGVWQCAAGWLRAASVAPDGRSAARRSLAACLPWLLTAVGGGRAQTWIALVAFGLPLCVHALWLGRGWRGWRVPVLPLGLAALGVGAGAGFLLLLRNLLLTRSVSGAGRSLHEVLLFSPLPEDLLLRVNPWAGRAIYPGVVALALALVGLWGLRRRSLTPSQRVLCAFGPLLVLGLALSLGPRLTVFPLFEAAFRLVPSWNFIRQPAKFQVLVVLALAVLGAAGAEALSGRLRRRAWRIALPVVLAVAVLVEYHPWRPAGVSRLPTAGRAYETIRGLGPRVLYIPLWPGDSSFSALYLYATTLTRVPMLNGYSAWVDRAYVTDVYRPLEAVNLGAVGDAEHATLTRYGVRQVVLDRDAFPLKVSPFGPAFTLASLRTSPFLELVRDPAEDGPLWVFRVRERAGAGASAAARSPLGIYWEAESLARDTGQITDDPEASNGRVVLGRAGRDRAGFLMFGPYRLLPAGPYRAVFRFSGEGSGLELQITTASGRRVLAAREARLADGRGFEELALTFTLDAPANVEYRVKWDGRGWAAADAVAVAFADVPDPAPSYAITELGHELTERRDADAERGRAGYADPAETPRDQLWHGPLRRYPAGRYRLWVRLKVDRPTRAPLAWCGVQTASLGPKLGGRELLGTEVPKAGQYVELAVPFTVPRPVVLEFPCIYRGHVGVWFDRLRIEGPDPSG